MGEPNIKVSNCDKMASLKVLVLVALVTVAAGQSNFRCPEKDGYFEDTNQCDKYYDCLDGIAEERLCPDGLVLILFQGRGSLVTIISMLTVETGLTSSLPRAPVISAHASMVSTPTLTPACVTSSTPVWMGQLRNTHAPLGCGLMSTVVYATGPRPLIERSAKLTPMKLPMGSSVMNLPLLMSLASTILIPSTLTLMTVQNSSSV